MSCYPQENPLNDVELHALPDEVFLHKDGAENNFFEFLEPHLGQILSESDSCAEKTNSSNRFPHSSHLNSNIGILSFKLFNHYFYILYFFLFYPTRDNFPTFRSEFQTAAVQTLKEGCR